MLGVKFILIVKVDEDVCLFV